MKQSSNNRGIGTAEDKFVVGKFYLNLRFMLVLKQTWLILIGPSAIGFKNRPDSKVKFIQILASNSLLFFMRTTIAH